MDSWRRLRSLGPTQSGRSALCHRNDQAHAISSNVAYTMRYLALFPEIQQELRNECLAFSENTPFDQLDTLPMLNAVIRETIRVAPPGPVTAREAMKDDVIRLSRPIADTDGNMMDEVEIRKGQTIYLHMRHYNTSTDLWGPDAVSWRPSRWLGADKKRGVPDSVPDGPGVWPNVLSFGDGPRRCMGYRLWLIEVKMIIFALIRGYEWEPVEGLRMYKTFMFTIRPMVEGEEDKDYSMPLIMRPYKGE